MHQLFFLQICALFYVYLSLFPISSYFLRFIFSFWFVVIVGREWKKRGKCPQKSQKQRGVKLTNLILLFNALHFVFRSFVFSPWYVCCQTSFCRWFCLLQSFPLTSEEWRYKRCTAFPHLYVWFTYTPPPLRKKLDFFFKSKISLTRLKQNFLQCYFVTK